MKTCHAVCLSHVPSGGAARAGAGFLTPPPDPQPGAADGTGGDTHGGNTYSKDAGSSSADSTAQPVSSQAADCSLAAAAARQQPEGGAAAAAKPSTPGELTLELGLQRLPETEYGCAAHPVAAAIVAAVAAREPKAERSLMHRYVAGAVRSFRVEASAPVRAWHGAPSMTEHCLGFARLMIRWRVQLSGGVLPQMEECCSGGSKMPAYHPSRHFATSWPQACLCCACLC